MDLPADVVREDRRLETTASKASEELARLRWHWTLDESNNVRVTIDAYAAATGKQRSLIYRYAHGYTRFRHGTVTLAEAIERAGMGADREAATQAVAEARNVAFGTARQRRPSEVQRVLDMGRERVELRGGSIEEQTGKVAELIVQAEKTAVVEEKARTERLGLRFIEVEEDLQRVVRILSKVVRTASAIGWGDEEQELLGHTLASARALIELANLAIVGAADVDWDAELASIGGE
jgi:hypothetical protein